MKCEIEIVIPGFPGRSSYGLSGLSSVYLIKTPKTNILFDTGSFGQRRFLLPKLREMGYPPEKIEHLIISHAHWDHIMNFQFFPNAKIYIHHEDIKFARSREGEVDLSFPKPYMRELLDTPDLKILNTEELVLEGIRLMHTPGHTPGSISAVMDTSWGATIICGDTIKNRAEFFSNSYDIRGDEKVFLQSIEKIRAIADAIAPGHDFPFTVQYGRYLAEAGEDMSITANFYKDINKKSHFLCRRPPDSK